VDEYEEASGTLIENLLQRQRLFERLARIQRSISHHAPLQEVLDAITAGACELLGDEVVGLRLIDEDDPSHCIIASSCGVKASIFDSLRRSKVGDGAGGLAILEDRLVVLDDYATSSAGLPIFVEDGLVAAMAAPVHEEGTPVGSLVVASYAPGRRYSHTEREVLLAFAQHASLALGDARLVEAMREAQRSKEMFFAIVSHELKTPLAAIVGNLHTLIKNQHKIDPALQREMMSTARERAQELSGLINRILAGARAELASAKQDAFLPDLIDDAAKGFKESGALTMASVPEILVSVDRQAVREVIGILLENALSHSVGEDEIFLEASAGNGQVCVGVRNTGSLPKDFDTGRLFAAFEKGPDAMSDGVGLGLYIASRLAQSIGGKIDVRTADESVEFVLNWPLEAPAGTDTRDDEMSAR